MKKCSNPDCVHEFADDMSFCPYCGTKWIYQKRKCPNPDCGFDDIPDGALFCPSCGNRLDNEKDVEEEREKAKPLSSVTGEAEHFSNSPKKEEANNDYRYVTICGDTTWYAGKPPAIKIYINNIQVGAVPHKGKITLKLKKERVILLFKRSPYKYTYAECEISSDFNGVVQLSSNRWSGRLFTNLSDDKTV